LDEGDFVIQPVLKTGKSLDDVIQTTTRIEQLLLDNFPNEVKSVVTRIGAAEVPTDPMSMEETDVIITLHPKENWKRASNKDQLADLMHEKLAIIPELELEFTQPIEMRFNELITGVRSDIAIKLFGNDLNVLQRKGNEIKALIEHIEGAADVVVEKVTGLPQLSVKFDRTKLAMYGLSILEINDLIAMGFAGKKLGVLFEKEKRFDLVVRLPESNRKNIDDLKNLLIDTKEGNKKIPLHHLASIEQTEGPAKISRDATNRRIVIGVNVRNSDLQTVVDQIQKKLKKDLTIPAGYHITYGGQFENYQRATSRLIWAVPIALLLIFIMLYFAFHSVHEAILIYSAIPFAAVGGVALLWLRDMPFSITAGVGFIALFGVAVLNGIVLIEHYKTFNFKDEKNRHHQIIQGARDRLLPVLLTASTTALGFLPMAVSSGAGAEVQRPVATVVIGGLITSTLLTLILLPLLYSWLVNRAAKKNDQ
jgi:cobalt-zinc-cadmium resistance protein CzcA